MTASERCTLRKGEFHYTELDLNKSDRRSDETKGRRAHREDRRLLDSGSHLNPQPTPQAAV